MSIEKAINLGLVSDEAYARKVVPHLKKEYFEGNDLIIFEIIHDFFIKYNTVPPKEAIIVSVEERKTLNEDQYNNLLKYIEEIEPKKVNVDWLVDKTEQFCQDKAIFNAVRHSIQILNGEDKKHKKDVIPELLSDALSVSFIQAVGHDFLNDYLERYDFYHSDQERIPFALNYFNKISNGGIPNKTLTVILSLPGVGKTLFMTDWATYLMMQGKNVLYITGEMSEERIAERGEAKLFNTEVTDLVNLSKTDYINKIQKFAKQTVGNIIIQEYPTSTANVTHFKALLRELKIKKSFVPDIIFVDYLNIFTSARFHGGNANSYTIVKSIAEEFRGLAVEYDVPVVTATQVNRSGTGNMDLDIDNTSESFGIPAVSDIFFALITNDEFEEKGQLLVKQLKNRFGPLNNPRRFLIGVDRSKMKLFDLEDIAQEELLGGPVDKPVMDNKFGGKPNIGGFI